MGIIKRVNPSKIFIKYFKANYFIIMEENLKSLIDFYHPNESEKFPNIDSLKLTYKYLTPPEPNPKKVRIFYRNLQNPTLPIKASICFVHDSENTRANI